MVKKTAIEVSVEKEVVKAYKETLDKLRWEIGNFFEKHEKSGLLDYKEANKYNRLSRLEEKATNQLKELGLRVKRIEKEYAEKAYKKGYYDTGYNVEMAVLMDLRYACPRDEVVVRCIESEISGCRISERVLKNTVNSIFNIKGIMKRGFIDGKGYAAIAGEIKRELGKETYESLRIAQTELHRASVEGRLASMEHAEVEGVKIKKVWAASMDKRTRETHGELDGTEIDVDEEFEWTAADGAKVSALGPGLSGNAGEDINCRCAVVERVKGLEAAKRSDAGGNRIAYVIRKEWMKQHKFEE